MARTIQELTIQLDSWGRLIHEIAARSERAGVPVRFDDLMYLDELRALHVIAGARLDAYRFASDAEQESIGKEIDSIWSELERALGRPRTPRPGKNGSFED
jgi:hypothetical protein